MKTLKAIKTKGGNLTLTSVGDLIIGNSKKEDITAGAGEIILLADYNENGIGNLSFKKGGNIKIFSKTLSSRSK